MPITKSRSTWNQCRSRSRFWMSHPDRLIRFFVRLQVSLKKIVFYIRLQIRKHIIFQFIYEDRDFDIDLIWICLSSLFVVILLRLMFCMTFFRFMRLVHNKRGTNSDRTIYLAHFLIQFAINLFLFYYFIVNSFYLIISSSLSNIQKFFVAIAIRHNKIYCELNKIAITYHNKICYDQVRPP